MKELIHGIIFGKDVRVSALIALMIVGSIALGCNCGKGLDLSNIGKNDSSTPSPTSSPTVSKSDASKGEVPKDDELQAMARKTVLDFNDAIQSGDFSDFHKTMSKPFQKQASPDKLKNVFHAFIDANINFREVSSLTASFTSTPSVAKSLGYKTLTLKGVYPTTPRKTNFELKYIPESQDWKLSSIEINTKDQ